MMRSEPSAGTSPPLEFRKLTEQSEGLLPRLLIEYYDGPGVLPWKGFLLAGNNDLIEARAEGGKRVALATSRFVRVSPQPRSLFGRDR